MSKKFIQRCKELVKDPVFAKPIQNKDYSQQGEIILVTRIKPNPSYAKQ